MHAACSSNIFGAGVATSVLVTPMYAVFLLTELVCCLQGWCVHAAQHIHQGAFVCHYVGEYITATEARQRLALYDQDAQKGHALLVR